MSRIVHTESAGKDRIHLLKSIVLAIRELAQQDEPNKTSQDLVAFISLALSAVSKTIDTSVTAWEKRGYWVKADRFRMEWSWSGQLAEEMRIALLRKDWSTITIVATKIAHKLKKITVSEKNRLGKPWVGAWEEIHKQ
jgi:hypothetical protein